MRIKSNGFRQPCLKKDQESEEKSWFPTAFLIKMDPCGHSTTILKLKRHHITRIKSNGFRQPCLKKKQESEEKSWFPAAFLIKMDQLGHSRLV
jgi:hypothetical protein